MGSFDFGFTSRIRTSLHHSLFVGAVYHKRNAATNRKHLTDRLFCTLGLCGEWEKQPDGVLHR
jgi:hypothetical protein